MRSQRTILLALLISSAAMVLTAAQARAPAPARHNIVLFVPDGLRALIVDEKTTPALAALRDRGVNFASPHSVFPTVTTQNASAMATGHYPGDHGNFGNMFWAGVPIRSVTRSVTPYMESDVALGDMDQAFGGDYLNGATFVKAARDAGIRTAVIGKVGPALIFDHTDRAGEPTIVIDDATGTANGIPLSSEMRARLMAASLPLQSPPRGDNGNIAGTLQSNHVQQDYFVDVTTKVILPWFKAGGQPFVLVFWSRDPDGSEHNEGDSLNRLDPGINGPTSMAGLRDADGDLRRLEDALDALGLTATTDIIVAADHGFSTASKQSETSSAAHASYAGVPRGQLPKGFLAIDLAALLHLPLFDPDRELTQLSAGTSPFRQNGVIGTDPQHPRVIVGSNGGSDLIYLPGATHATADQIVTFLGTQDYTSGIFVDEALGTWPGTLPLSAINLVGTARTPRPSIVVTYRSWSTGCAQPLLCAVDVSDAEQQQGQGTHGSLSRADTMNFMAAAGPDFKSQYVDRVPVGNADVGRTIAALLGVELEQHGDLVGRVITESLRNGRIPTVTNRTLQAHGSAGNVKTRLNYFTVEGVRYLDAGGTLGRTLGLR